MRLADVNILVYAFRTDAPAHAAHRGWLEALVASDEAYAVSDYVLAGFLRIVTHPRVFLPPTPLDAALAFTAAFRGRPNAVPVQAGARHWDLFPRLYRAVHRRWKLLERLWSVGWGAPRPEGARPRSTATPYPTMAPIDQYRMTPAAEIGLAKSAAPAAISADADILVLGAAGYETAVKGTNGF